MSTGLFALVLLLLPTFGTGLVCFEDDEHGVTHKVNSTNYHYCGLIPATSSRQGKLFALGEDNDYFPTYEKTFTISDPFYRIVTVCMLEEFRFGHHHPKMQNEFVFRCVCNFDLCNAESTFSEYLNAIKVTTLTNESKPAEFVHDRLI